MVDPLRFLIVLGENNFAVKPTSFYVSDFPPDPPPSDCFFFRGSSAAPLLPSSDLDIDRRFAFLERLTFLTSRDFIIPFSRLFQHIRICHEGFAAGGREIGSQ